MMRDTMTSAERMGAVMKGEKPDRVPVIPFVNAHCAIVSGQPVARFYDNAETSFRVQLLSAELYGYEGSPAYRYGSVGAWEFGGEIEFPHKKFFGSPVITRYPVQTEEDAINLQVPDDITAAGAFPLALTMARLQMKHHMPVTMHIGSILSWTGNVISAERLLAWMIEKPQLVHAVLDKVAQFQIKVAEHYVKEFAPESIMAFMGAPTESNKLISPKHFETFVLPYVSRVNQRAIDLGVQMFFAHLCGEQNKNLKLWQKVPFGKRAVMSFGREVNLKTAMEMFPNSIIAGNVDPTLIQEGKPEEVLDQARECIEMAKYHPGGYVLMAGCEVPPEAPPVNLFQLIKASREFGRY